MTFVNLSLLAGTALVALPLILHLIMRRKPRHFEFPAIRFIQKRQDTNRRQMRLRHLLLLLLRAAAIALLAFALARPTVKLSGAWGRHPLNGRMYLPCYRAGTEKVAELRRHHPPDKIIPALYQVLGLVDVVTIDRVL
jgi:hypothetical protein